MVNNHVSRRYARTSIFDTVVGSLAGSLYTIRGYLSMRCNHINYLLGWGHCTHFLVIYWPIYIFLLALSTSWANCCHCSCKVQIDEHIASISWAYCEAHAGYYWLRWGNRIIGCKHHRVYSIEFTKPLECCYSHSLGLILNRILDEMITGIMHKIMFAWYTGRISDFILIL